MTVLRMMINIPADSGLSEDICVNNLHWETDDVLPATLNVIEGWVSTFYNAWAAYRSPQWTWEQTTVKWYKMGDPPPRAPVREVSLALNASTGTQALPPELALCCSFQGNRVSGIPQARQRGRIYLGPLAGVAADTTLARPANAFTTAVQSAADALITVMTGDTNKHWIVFTKYAGPVPGGGDWHARVTNGWIDDAWDIQRRRGNRPTSRKLFAP